MVLLTRARYDLGVTRHLYRFDQYSVDPATRELRRQGELVVLSPKVFDCIAWLIEHRDRAVGRDELVAAVWGKADIADTQLVQTLLKARRAIGDSGEQQRLIRTIPRFGYRWVGEVETVETRVPAPGAGTVDGITPETLSLPASEPAVIHARNPRKAWLALAGAVALLAVGVWAWSLRPARSSAPARVEAVAAIALSTDATVVLPATVSAGAEWSWLRLGLMDLVAQSLRSAGLAVVPSDNVVALLRELAADDAATRLVVRKTVGPRWMIRPTARQGAQGWTVHLELRGENDASNEVEATSSDPTVAAREATSQLLQVLGRSSGEAPNAIDDGLPRIRAALLGNDFETARRLLHSLPPFQRDRPEVHLLQAQTDFGTGNAELAYAGFTVLLDDVREETDPVLRARAFNGRGASSIRLANAVPGERDFDAALTLLRNHNEPALTGQAYSGRGITRAMQDRDEEAMADFASARVALQLAGDSLALARVDSNEAALSGRRGRTADALAGFRRAAGHFERFGALNELAGALVNQVEAHLALLEPERALQVSERAQALADRIENPSIRHLIGYWRASALASVGRLAEARAHLDELTSSPDPSQDTGVLMLAWNQQAVLALASGQAEAAAALARRAIVSATGPQWVDLRAETWLTLTRALRAQGRNADAAAEVLRMMEWAPDENRVASIRVQLAQAESAWSAGRREASALAYTEALRMAERHSVPSAIAEVVESWGNTLIADGELEAASAVIGRVARFADSDFTCALLQARLYRTLGQTTAWQTSLVQVRALAGERPIPEEIVAPARTPVVLGR